MAIAIWPRRSFELSPSLAVGSDTSASTRSRARSVSGSSPSTRAWSSRPSSVVSATRRAPWTTWLLVSARPSDAMMTPEPDPALRPRLRTSMRTTLGPTRSTTSVTTREYWSSSAASFGGCETPGPWDGLSASSAGAAIGDWRESNMPAIWWRGRRGASGATGPTGRGRARAPKGSRVIFKRGADPEWRSTFASPVYAFSSAWPRFSATTRLRDFSPRLPGARGGCPTASTNSNAFETRDAREPLSAADSIVSKACGAIPGPFEAIARRAGSACASTRKPARDQE